MSKKSSQSDIDRNNWPITKKMEPEVCKKEEEEISEIYGNENDKTRESDSETDGNKSEKLQKDSEPEEKVFKVASEQKSEAKQKVDKRFDKSKLSLFNFRLDDKSRRDSSPEPKDNASEHSESSKIAEEKAESLRVPFSEAPLGTGPGRGGLFGASATRTSHFPPPVFMWCPTIGLPPWCPALFPTGLVHYFPELKSKNNSNFPK